jgi:ribosomal protein L37E
MSDYPECPLCGKRAFPSVKSARCALAGAGNRIRVYQCGGAFHVTDNEKITAPAQKHWRNHLEPRSQA